MSDRPVGTSSTPPADPAELARLVDELRDTVAELRSESSFMPSEAPAHTWLSVLEAPARRRPVVPRMLLEALFLAACATAAAFAELDAVGIAGVMIGAWVLVGLIEWASSRVDRRREELLLAAPPTPVPVAVPAAPDPAWYNPPVEQTLLDFDAPLVESTGFSTAVTRLPELDDTMHVPDSIDLTLPALPATAVDEIPAAIGETTGIIPAADAADAPDEELDGTDQDSTATAGETDDGLIDSWPALAELPADDVDDDPLPKPSEGSPGGTDAVADPAEPGIDDTFERRPSA